MKVSNKCFLIVDAYSTGQYLAPALRSYGYQCAHLSSSSDVPRLLRASFQPADFVKDLVWKGSMAKLREELAPFKVMAVIPGSEMGVLLADSVSAALGLATTNDPGLSLARRDKYLMTEALRARGVRAARQMKSSRVEEVLAWSRSAEVERPIVLKPIKSAGTQGVHICRDEREIRAAFDDIIGSRDFFSNANNEVLAQEFLQGQEYAVNSVSRDDRHHVSEIMEAHKNQRDGAPIYDYSDMVSPDERPELFAELAGYAASVLDALGVRYGASHAEIMLTPKGPTLIEVGARLNGGIDPSAYAAALGYNQVSLLVESYLDPECFLQRLELPRPALRSRLRVAFLVSDRGGRIARAPRLEGFAALESFHSAAVCDSGELQRTASFVTSPGYVNLVHPERAVIAGDYRAIRGREQAVFEAMLEAVPA